MRPNKILRVVSNADLGRISWNLRSRATVSFTFSVKIYNVLKFKTLPRCFCLQDSFTELSLKCNRG